MVAIGLCNKAALIIIHHIISSNDFFFNNFKYKIPNNSRTETPAPSSNSQHYFKWNRAFTLKLIDILGRRYEHNQYMTLLKLYQGEKTNTEVAKIIVDNFDDDDPKPNFQKVMTKIKGLEQEYQEANTFLKSTGEGIKDDEEKHKIRSIKG